MQEGILDAEPVVRLAAFAGVFALLAGLELLVPRRAQEFGRASRWPNNLGIVLLDTVVVRLLFPTAAVGFAVVCEVSGWGLLNRVALPNWLEFVFALVVLDLALYGQHVAFHAVPVLWRLHRMHHADLEFDVTTGVRFHPVEIVLSMLIKSAVVALVGASAVAVLAFEVLLNATSMFSHSNIRLPLWLDGIVRWVLVTPDMHRVHHSAKMRETNSNFGFNLAVWDRLLGTYRPEPEAGHDGMVIGLPVFREARDLRLDQMLVQPLRSPKPSRSNPTS